MTKSQLVLIKGINKKQTPQKKSRKTRSSIVELVERTMHQSEINITQKIEPGVTRTRWFNQITDTTLRDLIRETYSCINAENHNERMRTQKAGKKNDENRNTG